MRRHEAFDRLRGVRDELAASRIAITETTRLLEARHSALTGSAAAAALKFESLRTAGRNLEVTYALRLFGEFEGVLVGYWRDGMGRATRPTVRVLIDRIAADREISPGHRAGADRVRRYRNNVVHEQERGSVLPFDECKAHLGRFLSWLPEQW